MVKNKGRTVVFGRFRRLPRRRGAFVQARRGAEPRLSQRPAARGGWSRPKTWVSGLGRPWNRWFSLVFWRFSRFFSMFFHGFRWFSMVFGPFRGRARQPEVPPAAAAHLGWPASGSALGLAERSVQDVARERAYLASSCCLTPISYEKRWYFPSKTSVKQLLGVYI